MKFEIYSVEKVLFLLHYLHTSRHYYQNTSLQICESWKNPSKFSKQKIKKPEMRCCIEINMKKFGIDTLIWRIFFCNFFSQFVSISCSHFQCRRDWLSMIQFKKVEKKDGHKVKLESLTAASHNSTVFPVKLSSRG